MDVETNEDWEAYPYINTELENDEYFKESVDSAKKIGSLSLDLDKWAEFGDLAFEDYIYLAYQLKDSNIENINLKDFLLDDEELTVLSAVLKDTKIKNLNLESNQFGINGLLALLSALKESQIEVLNLSHNNYIKFVINIFADSLPFTNITSLNLGFIDLEFFFFQNLADVLANTKITVLSLEKCQLNEMCIEYLSKKLSNSKVQSLNLAENKMSLDSLKSLADVLENTAITELIIYSNKIGPAGAQYLAGKLSKSVVQKLDIGNNDMKSEGCLAIGNVIHLTQISKLDLEWNSIDCSGITSLAENLKKSNVKHLNLNFNNLRINGAQILANGMKDSKLEYLAVDFNKITNVGMGMILDALQFTKITNFDSMLSTNEMNVENMKFLTNPFKYFKLNNLHITLLRADPIIRAFFNELKTLIESNKPDEISSIKNKMNFLIDLEFGLFNICNNIEYVCDVIKHFHMNRFFSSENDIDNETWVPSLVEILIDIKNPISNIKTLILSGEGIKDRDAIVLAKNFKYLKITRLELNKCEIMNDGVIAIADELKNSQIRCLSLIDNSYDSIAASYLTNVVKNHPVRIRLNRLYKNGLSIEDQLVIKNINCMYLRVELLIRAISDNSPVKYDKDLIEYIKAYEIFKNVDLLWESDYGEPKYDFNRINSQIRSNVYRNFLKIIGVVNSDEIISNFLPTEIILMICSYLKVNDIKFNK